MAKQRQGKNDVPTAAEFNKRIEEATRWAAEDEYVTLPLGEHDSSSQSASQDKDKTEQFPSENSLYGKGAQGLISKKMHQMKGEGRPRKQKVAIALSVARKKGLKVPKR